MLCNFTMRVLTTAQRAQFWLQRQKESCISDHFSTGKYIQIYLRDTGNTHGAHAANTSEPEINKVGGFQRQRAQPQQQQQYQQRAQPQQQQQYQGNNQGGNAQQQMQFGNAHPLPTNYSYCSTHGYAVSSQHNSMSCINCAPGHQANPTRQNPMGGSQAGAHRLNF